MPVAVVWRGAVIGPGAVVHCAERTLGRIAAFERKTVGAAFNFEVERHEGRREGLVRGVDLCLVATAEEHAGLEVRADPRAVARGVVASVAHPVPVAKVYGLQMSIRAIGWRQSVRILFAINSEKIPHR